MGLRNLFKIKPILALLVVCMLAVKAPVYAQATDSTSVSNTAATDSAVSNNSSASLAAQQPAISTDVDTMMLSWTGGGVDAPKPEVDHSETYKTAAYYTLLFILFCVFLAIIGKAMKVYEQTNEVQGKKKKYNANIIQSVLMGIALVAGLYGAYWSLKVQGAMSVHESASVHGIRLDQMFTITSIITLIVFFITQFLLFGFAIKYRGREKRKAYYYPHNNAIERLWTIVPAVVLAILVLYGFITWRSITNVPEAEQKKAISMEVTGEQFKWNIRYAGADNQLGVKNYKLITPTNSLGINFKDQHSWDDKLGGEIVLPVNKPVRVTVNSKDIIHSFYIPAFKVQINAVPGMPTYFQFTPRFTTAEMRVKMKNPTYDYILLCAKICGAGHYNMQAKVTVVSEKEYEEWLAKQPLFYNDDVKKELQMASKEAASEENNKIALK
ncbi:cytochrome c oxidase subunit II (plasmid) [Pedobacter sp. BS3]|uniref:cytochrome c oxidase subunit II n=1 Tax=Pedobacter sp. BS3 TaxID=2567937 RepID=UPI0011EC94C5|nr:cytochrome c oxidase subunit II [Pedobacter sp. BS3]TZF85532.1 cytochrome c oxidase subunit II [Pedobacter sp. BS3]